MRTRVQAREHNRIHTVRRKDAEQTGHTLQRPAHLHCALVAVPQPRSRLGGKKFSAPALRSHQPNPQCAVGGLAIVACATLHTNAGIVPASELKFRAKSSRSTNRRLPSLFQTGLAALCRRARCGAASVAVTRDLLDGIELCSSARRKRERGVGNVRRTLLSCRGARRLLERREEEKARGL